MEVKFDWKNFRKDKPKIDKLIIFKYPFNFCNESSTWKTVFILGEYKYIEHGEHCILGYENITDLYADKKLLAYNFYENINKFRYNHPNKKDECDFEWDYYSFM